MTLYQILGVVLIITMMALVFVATRFVSSVKYLDKGFWYITIRSYIWRDRKYMEWSKDNTVYLWSFVLILTLCATILGLIGSFAQQRMFHRPEWILAISPFLWFSLVQCYRWFVKRLKEIS